MLFNNFKEKSLTFYEVGGGGPGGGGDDDVPTRCRNYTVYWDEDGYRNFSCYDDLNQACKVYCDHLAGNPRIKDSKGSVYTCDCPEKLPVPTEMNNENEGNDILGYKINKRVNDNYIAAITEEKNEVNNIIDYKINNKINDNYRFDLLVNTLKIY